MSEEEGDTRVLRNPEELEKARRIAELQARRIREARGWTQLQLARKAKVKRFKLRNIENGLANSIHDLRKIAGALDVALSVRFISWATFLEDGGWSGGRSAQTDVKPFYDDEVLRNIAGPGGEDKPA